jgi:hypothetical protein
MHPGRSLSSGRARRGPVGRDDDSTDIVIAASARSVDVAIY